MAATKDQMHTGTDQAADATKYGVDLASRGVHTVVDKVADIADQGKKAVQKLAGDAGDAAGQAGDKVQKWAGDAYSATSHAVGDAGDEFTALVRKHPVPAILIGFGLGLLMGKILRT